MPTLLPPKKRQKKTHSIVATDSGTVLFRTGDDVRKALSDPTSDGLKTTLQSLRNQLTVQNHELPIASNDERLLLVQDWLSKSAGAPELFEIWESAAHNASVSALCIGTLAGLLSLLSRHYIYHADADPVIRRLLEPSCLRHLNSNLGAAQHELILVTLKLYNALVNFADGREKRAIMDGFGWGMKSLPKLFNMRRRGGKVDAKDALDKPDIRTLFILFILSYMTASTPTPLKSALLEDQKDLFIGIFQGINEDAYAVVQRILEVSWDGVWCDSKVPRTTKIRLFGESTLSQLTKLYSRSEPEGEENHDVPADLVHHFLLAITTRPGTGLCFHERGWYPRTEDLDAARDDYVGEEEEGKHGGVYNKILRNFLKSLRVNEDSRQQELALKILQACPELVQSYWSTTSISFEPRLSSRWITNVAFLGSVIALPVPTRSFAAWDPRVPSTSTSTTPTSYLSAPPPLATIVENITPSTFSKEYISKGLLSHKEPLVVHCTALALAKILAKFATVRDAFIEVETVLEENTETGLWQKRRQEVEKEIRRRVPEFQVIIALSQKYISQPKQANSPETPDTVPTAQKSLVSEIALRLMGLYHRLLPELVSETKFDSGKLLNHARLSTSETEGMTELETLSQLHVLRLLTESDQFSWTGKPVGSPHSQLHHIIMLALQCTNAHLRQAALSLASTSLSCSVIFDHDTSEPEIWLDALPRLVRSPNAKAPDGTALINEPFAVTNFLDECILRCTKTPYHYLEGTLDLFYGTSQEGRQSPQFAPSPLFATILEQLAVKQSRKLLQPPEILAIVTYLRRLLIGLMGKQPDVTCALRLLEAVHSTIKRFKPDDSPSIAIAVEREVRLFDVVLARLRCQDSIGESKAVSANMRSAVQSFLSAMEASAAEVSSSTISLAELVDWVRFIDAPLLDEDVTRLICLFSGGPSYDNALLELVSHLEPARIQISSVASSATLSTVLSRPSGLGWALMLCTAHDLQNPDIRLDFANAICQLPQTDAILRNLRLATHFLLRIAPPEQDPTFSDAILLLFTSVLEKVARIPGIDAPPLKHVLFKESDTMRRLLCSSHRVSPVYARFIRVALDPQSPADQTLATEYCAFWSSKLPTSLAPSGKHDEILNITPWIPFSNNSIVAACLDLVLQPILSGHCPDNLREISTTVLEEVSKAVLQQADPTSTTIILSHISELVAAAEALESTLLTRMLQSMVESLLPVGLDLALPSSRQREAHSQPLSTLTEASGVRWRTRAGQLPSGLRQTSPRRSNLTPLRASVAAVQLYRPSTDTFSGLLDLADALHAPFSPALLSPISAGLDVHLAKSAPAPEVSLDLIDELLANITSKSRPRPQRQEAARCLSALFQLSNDSRRSLIPHIVAHVVSLPCPHFFRAPLQSLLWRLARTTEKDILSSLVNPIIDRGLYLAVRQFSNEPTDSIQFTRGVEGFKLLVETCDDIKPHLAEPVFSSGVLNRLHVPAVTQLLSALATRTKLKPINSNRLIQSILQHQSFLAVTAQTKPLTTTASRESLVDLLHSLFAINPTNACQPSHITPLSKIYGGTVSRSDCQLRTIFERFEEHRSLSSIPLFKHWCATYSGTSSSLLEALTSLDPNIVMRTYTHFPSPSQYAVGEDNNDGAGYDPRFLLCLLSGVLADTRDFSHMDWVNLFRTNIASVALRALASNQPELREIACHALFVLGHSLKDVDFQERDEVLLVLTLTRDAMPLPSAPDSSDALPSRISTLHALLLAHALRCIFYPSSIMYPLIMRFLLQRPEIDTSDVPMLFASLYSTSDEWRQERWWIIHLIADGMSQSQDWKILTRRHVWDLLATIFQSSPSDKSLRKSILEAMSRMANHRRSAMALVLRTSVISWIELQMGDLQTPEVGAWLRILSNLVINVEQSKCDAATLGAWRDSVTSCLLKLSEAPGQTLERTYTICCIYRHVLAGGGASFSSPHLADALIGAVSGVEVGIDVSTAAVEELQLFQARNAGTALLAFVRPDTPALWVWGHCVELLWEAEMLTNRQSVAKTWDSLTSRLLLWNTVSGYSKLGEWARMETIRQMLQA